MSTHCQPPSFGVLYGTLGTPIGIILVTCLLNLPADLLNKCKFTFMLLHALKATALRAFQNHLTLAVAAWVFSKKSA